MATAGRDRNLRLWETKTWREVLVWPIPEHAFAITFALNDLCLVTSMPSEGLLIHQVKPGKIKVSPK
jgi:hypothetical protein